MTIFSQTERKRERRRRLYMVQNMPEEGRDLLGNIVDLTFSLTLNPNIK